MYIEMLIVNEESLANSRVAVVKGLQVKLYFLWQQVALIGCKDLPLVCEDGTAMPVLLLLQPLDYFLRC